MTAETLVSIRNLSKRFTPDGPFALKGINLDIPKGSLIGLAGPDGAGKTTLIRLIAALLRPTEGKVTVGGFDTVSDQDPLSFLIGYMPQRFGLYEDLTVMQNLNLYADLKGLKASEKKKTFEKLLDFTDLSSFTDRFARNLSGGMKQKLGLACSLISKPTLLLLDEPSVGVDPISRRELWKMVMNLLDEGITVLWSTSYLDEVEKCESIVLLHEGDLLYKGPSKGLSERVSGRTFRVKGVSENKRKFLADVMEQKDVMDGVLQGDNIRVLFQEKGMHRSIDGHALEPVPPNFEDAFIDIMNQPPLRKSLLAEKFPVLEKKKHAVIEAKGLTKKFGQFTAASDISFDVKRGEIFGLLGPNGAGKTTTFKMMCGLLTPTHGEAIVNDIKLVKSSGKTRAHIGYMAQKFSLYGNISVEQNLEFFSGIYNLNGKARKAKIEEMIEIFSFDPYLDTSAEELPLGFKQRLALACCVMHSPDVLFLDEPTSGVDPLTRREFWTHINGLVQKGITIMVTTHFMDEAEYCDRLGLVYKSRLIKIGTPERLKKEAATTENPTPSMEETFIQLIEEHG